MDVVLFSDSFQRADEAPLNPATWNVYAGQMQIVNMLATVGPDANSALQYPKSIAWSAKQFQRVAVHAMALGGNHTDFDYVRLYNASLSQINGYYGELFLTAGGLPVLEIWRVDAGGASEVRLATITLATPFQAGDTFYYSLDGVSEHFIEYNGFEVLTATDSTYTFVALPDITPLILPQITTQNVFTTSFSGYAAGTFNDLPDVVVPIPIPIPFSIRTTAAVTVFASMFIAGPQGAPALKPSVAIATALQLVYSQLVTVYSKLINQNTANNRLDFYAEIATAITAVSSLVATLNSMSATGDNLVVLQRYQTVAANALTQLQNAQSEEGGQGDE